MKAIIICERDGWTWRIEHQEECDSGVEIVYQEEGEKGERTCIGSLDDAEALAKAILTYVEFTRNNEQATN